MFSPAFDKGYETATLHMARHGATAIKQGDSEQASPYTTGTEENWDFCEGYELAVSRNRNSL